MGTEDVGGRDFKFGVAGVGLMVPWRSCWAASPDARRVRSTSAGLTRQDPAVGVLARADRLLGFAADSSSTAVSANQGAPVRGRQPLPSPKAAGGLAISGST